MFAVFKVLFYSTSLMIPRKLAQTSRLTVESWLQMLRKCLGEVKVRLRLRISGPLAEGSQVGVAESELHP